MSPFAVAPVDHVRLRKSAAHGPDLPRLYLMTARVASSSSSSLNSGHLYRFCVSSYFHPQPASRNHSNHRDTFPPIPPTLPPQFRPFASLLYLCSFFFPPLNPPKEITLFVSFVIFIHGDTFAPFRLRTGLLHLLCAFVFLPPLYIFHSSVSFCHHFLHRAAHFASTETTFLPATFFFHSGITHIHTKRPLLTSVTIPHRASHRHKKNITCR